LVVGFCIVWFVKGGVGEGVGGVGGGGVGWCVG